MKDLVMVQGYFTKTQTEMDKSLVLISFDLKQETFRVLESTLTATLITSDSSSPLPSHLLPARGSCLHVSGCVCFTSN